MLRKPTQLHDSDSGDLLLQWGRSGMLRKPLESENEKERLRQRFNGAGAECSGNQLIIMLQEATPTASMGPERNAPETQWKG